ncbi:MAG: hypothetical protein FJ243_02205 [Nitrospira sp.]|nr:hypothetical protein [Nitrospira sp.]
MNEDKQKIDVDSEIPVEQQIAFLRQSFINFQCNVFEFLKEKFGNEGIEMFKAIIRKGTRKGIENLKDKSFEGVKKVATIPDRILGLKIQQDYSTPDEFQYSITFCPYLEESKRRGLDMEFCNVTEEVQIEEVSKSLGEMSEPTRMCHGDSKCTIRLRNTLGR